MRTVFLASTLATLLLPACSTPHAAGKSGGLEPFAPDQPYVRIVDASSNLVELQIAVRKFVPAHAKGPALWLMGVSHIGEPGYYAQIQNRLNERTLVLFEGVGDHATVSATASNTCRPASGPVVQPAADEKSPPPMAAAKRSMSSLQSSLAASLGLVFQLDAIDYSRTNFRNCDLSIAEIRRLIVEQQTASGTDGASRSFESLMQVMQGDGLFEILIEAGLRFIGSNPKLQGMSKLALIEVLGQIQGDPAQLGGLPPDLTQVLDVLIAQRDRKVISELEAETVPHSGIGRRDSIAIFYGTGHMPDLERRLRQELGCRPAGQTWLTAFSVNLPQAGISRNEREFIRSFVQSQVTVKMQ